MRLDKFLKISRLTKRRTVANDLATGGNVLLNGKPAKPASAVKVGDILTLRMGAHEVTVQIAEVPDKAPPAQAAASLYTVMAETYNGASPHPDAEPHL